MNLTELEKRTRPKLAIHLTPAQAAALAAFIDEFPPEAFVGNPKRRYLLKRCMCRLREALAHAGLPLDLEDDPPPPANLMVVDSAVVEMIDTHEAEPLKPNGGKITCP